MTNVNKSRTGFTKIGFSKAGFGCCGHFSYCDMGKNECFYVEKDPEAQQYCAAYLRNHKKSTPSTPVVCEEEQKTKQSPQFSEEQLSLF